MIANGEAFFKLRVLLFPPVVHETFFPLCLRFGDGCDSNLKMVAAIFESYCSVTLWLEKGQATKGDLALF